MRNIAIIGTQGAGKTVLITMLADSLSKTNSHGLLFDPQNFQTQTYVAKNRYMLENGEWPSHTPVGSFIDLHWQVKISVRVMGDLRIIDAPGHDLRRIFAEENAATVEALPSELQRLARYCDEADITVFVANLDHYVARPGSTDHIDNEAVLKAAMDFARKRGKQYCLVLSQADQYNSAVSEFGSPNTEGSWIEMVRRFLPVTHASHLANGQTRVFPVACVQDTEVIPSGESFSPKPRPGFTSAGLGNLINWMGDLLNPPPPPVLSPQPVWWPRAIAGVVGVLFFIGTKDNIYPPAAAAQTAMFSSAAIFFVIWGILAGIRFAIKQVSKNG